jgi:RNA recognition motif-containing protein
MAIPDDFRIFVGDLGNEVSDEMLYKAFIRYSSIQKARIVRDRKSGKSKGYGFVSFKDPQDFLKAMREMNGVYFASTCPRLTLRGKANTLDTDRSSFRNHPGRKEMSM